MDKASNVRPDNSLQSHQMTYHNSHVSIVSSLGCNINDLVLDGQKVLDTNQEEERLLADFLSKSDFLAPFPNRICDGKYRFQGKTYQLVANETDKGHALHGLIINKEFSKVDQISTNEHALATFEAEILPDEFEGYPFHLLITFLFKLNDDKFEITITGKNLGNIDAPYGIGWHPYLTVGREIDECMLQIPARSTLETSETKELIPTGKKLDNIFGTKPELIGDVFFDTCFTDLKNNKIRFENIELFMDKSMKYVQMYTPDDRMSIAVEPMSCAPDAFNNGMGLITLVPQQSISHSFGIKIL